MVDATRYTSSGNSDDLKAKDFVGKNMKLTIHHVEEVTYDGDDGKKDEKLALHFAGKEKRLILNATNTGTLVEAYGSETDQWTGKEIALSTKDYTDKGFGHGWIVQPLDVELDDDIPF